MAREVHVMAGPRVVALAAVIEYPNGSRTIIGSRDIISMEYSMEVGPFHPFTATPTTYELSATMGSVQIHHAEPVDTPAVALPVRGIYLPNMAFRALPAPEDKP